LRHGGFDTKTDAEAELGQARKLLAIAAPDDPQTAIRIADAITASMRQDGALPDADRIRKAVGGGRDPAVKPPTTGEWLEEWLAAKKGLRPGTARSYAGHIRLYLKPHLGHIRIDRLRVTDIDSVFEHIEELNDAVTDARASRSPTRRAAVSGRRLVRPATCQRMAGLPTRLLPAIIALCNHAGRGAHSWSRPIGGPSARQHPTAEQAGSEHRDKTGTRK
jgi:hypothetical protein